MKGVFTLTNNQLEELYNKYHRELYLYSLSLCRNHHQAEDLASETFFKALMSLDEDTPYIKYWLIRVCKNLFLDNVRKNKEYSSLNEDLLVTDETPLDNLIDSDERKQLYRLVMELHPPSYREIIVLFYYCDFSLKEIAKTTGMTEGAAKTLLFRARKKLRTAMEVNYEI